MPAGGYIPQPQPHCGGGTPPCIGGIIIGGIGGGCPYASSPGMNGGIPGIPGIGIGGPTGGQLAAAAADEAGGGPLYDTFRGARFLCKSSV
mmetsp:Transcript_47484/g.101572  ORF Transcript_47484/g.101572 Transcript_47484/m.101572 type:complete len:91 (-) Transcript_47484:243-515(-)